MQNFKSTLTLLVAAGCCVAPDMAHAFQLIREEADIRLVDGTPAICIPEKAKGSFPVANLLLLEYYTLESESWAIRLKDDAKPMKLKPGNCIAYGSIPDGYERDGPDNRENFQLKLNTTYYFQAIRQIPNLWYLRTAIYEATFCLKTDADGALSIQKKSACPDFSR
ncbi:hypothetical protein [Stenotrophomonas muris]|uniref:hypothetical protein n=1 Tax=Stenotrophomonas muris TaxID=2963283 RepID=UPI001D999626|nr:hypothetical protein [uncultured Stenotrophomonas sp.]MBN5017030.1 hypothetical protein [Stenotrophomonas maltophilia]MBN5034239.1 hypothetical protein [Stenotrophomonas maltophilia]MCI1145202.1 hypothetical protein [Stenotrophomonas maltophilia]